VCSLSTCKQKDFLPFTCDACGKPFCLSHRSYVTHSCTNASSGDHRVVECPLCGLSIHFTEGSNVNVQFENHLQTVCTGGNNTNVPDHKKKKTDHCCAPKCREKLLLSNRIMCQVCKLETCLQHRHRDDHACKGPPCRSNYFLSSSPQPANQKPVGVAKAAVAAKKLQQQQQSTLQKSSSDPSNSVLGTAARRMKGPSGVSTVDSSTHTDSSKAGSSCNMI
jgi:predicted nucleic acid binding AN1-type Zn finger protein